MKHKIILIMALTGMMIISAASAFAAETSTPPATTTPAPTGPSIFAPEEKYEFSPVAEGVEITHDFVIQNKGTSELVVENVKTSCGCTTTSYTRQIAPGAEGKIAVKVNTNGYGGRKVTHNIIVSTNDKANPSLTLTISGNVDRFVTITPPAVKLTGAADQAVSTTVTLVPDEKYPFKIVEPSPGKGENIAYKLEETKKDGRTEYVLTVENTKKSEGKYFENIKLKTDSRIQPEIRISVYGSITAGTESKASESKGSEPKKNM